MNTNQRRWSPRSYAASSLQIKRGDQEVGGNFSFWRNKRAHSHWPSRTQMEPLWEGDRWKQKESPWLCNKAKGQFCHIWQMSPQHLAFTSRSVYEVLPSRTNLQQWSPRFQLQTLWMFPHSPKYMVIQSGHSRGGKDSMLPGKYPKKCISIREGSSQHHKVKNQRRELLSKAKDLEVTEDLKGERHCYNLLWERGKWPDLVLATETDSFILLELTVPWEDRMNVEEQPVLGSHNGSWDKEIWCTSARRQNWC